MLALRPRCAGSAYFREVTGRQDGENRGVTSCDFVAGLATTPVPSTWTTTNHIKSHVGFWAGGSSTHRGRDEWHFLTGSGIRFGALATFISKRTRHQKLWFYIRIFRFPLKKKQKKNEKENTDGRHVPVLGNNCSNESTLNGDWDSILYLRENVRLGFIFKINIKSYKKEAPFIQPDATLHSFPGRS